MAQGNHLPDAANFVCLTCVLCKIFDKLLKRLCICFLQTHDPFHRVNMDSFLVDPAYPTLSFRKNVSPVTTQYGLFFIGGSQKIWNIPSGNSNNVNQYARVGERNGETNNKKKTTCNRHGIFSALKAMKLTSFLLPAEEMNSHLTMQLHRILIFYQGQSRGNVKM